jgi:RHS repeat-associated protein
MAAKHPKHFYVKDNLGSTRAVVDEAGDVVEAYDYYPFGLQSRSYKEKGDPLTKETFTGKEEDIESNLHYFGARYYDAGAAKFLSVDPKYYLYPFTSPYVYTINNPINYIDPNGMEVVFSDSSQAAEAAAALNEVNEGADISVETETEEHSLFFGLITWTSTTYKLSTVSTGIKFPKITGLIFPV